MNKLSRSSQRKSFCTVPGVEPLVSGMGLAHLYEWWPTARLAEVAQHHRSVLEQVRVHVVQFHDVLGVRSFMDTVNALQLALLEFLRAAVVRDEHALFDPRIGFVMFARHNLDRFAILVELAAVFCCLEFEQTFLGAVLLEECCHFGKSLDRIVTGFHHLQSTKKI